MSVIDFIKQQLGAKAIENRDLKMIEAGALVFRSSFMTRIELGELNVPPEVMVNEYFASVSSLGTKRIMAAVGLDWMGDDEIAFLGRCFVAGYLEADCRSEATKTEGN